MRKNLALAALFSALALLTGCSGTSSDEESAGSAGGAVAEGGAGDSAGGERGAVGGVTGGEESAAGGEPRTASLPGLRLRVIQVAFLHVSVGKGDFNETVDRARTIAAGFGGFVVSSSASQGAAQRLERGSLVLRIPGRSYAEAMQRLAGLGRVEEREESGQDVAQEFVDLEARRRHLQAVENQLLRLLDRANTVAAALLVQSRLNEVQLELEQVRGRIGYLDDEVSYATITLELHERGAVAKPESPGFNIVEAWQTAGNGFVTVVGWMFVALATAAPVLILIALGFFLWRYAGRRRMRAAGA